ANYDDEDTRKYAILLTNASNYGGAADNAATLEICNQMKANGIKIYTISFGAPADAQAMLQSCSSTDRDFNYYFDSPTEASLKEAFKSISRDINSIRLIE